MKRKLTIGVMGPGPHATEKEIEIAHYVGYEIAKRGHFVLTGGSNTGVMNAALYGAKEYSSDAITIGILSSNGEPEKTSSFADIKIPTGMGEGRNYFNIRSCDIIIFCCFNVHKSAGTYSEFTFTIKHKKPVIFFYATEIDEEINFFKTKWEYLIDSLCNEDRHGNQFIVWDKGRFETILDLMIENLVRKS